MIIGQIHFAPEAASRSAEAVDRLSLALLGIGTFFSAGIAVAIIVYVIRYWHARDVNRHTSVSALKHWAIEVTWMVIPFIILMIVFVWGGVIYIRGHRPPEDAIQIHVVAKQWMWKIAHQNGRREINSLHLPLGKPARLTMVSEDVIHSFFVPAFRKKQDVLPGRLTTIWFYPTKTGVYHLFCAEYCGTDHSRMIGQVIVQTPEQYAAWLAEGTTHSLAQRGRRLVEQFGCLQCHGLVNGRQVGPPLTGLFGKPVPLADGSTIIADLAYIRESLRNPNAKIHAGYEPTMPSYRERLAPEQLLEVVAYIRSIADAAGPLAGPGTANEVPLQAKEP